MQWISADVVFDGYNFHESLYLLVKESGKIEALQNTKPQEQVRHYKGMLMPGMINAHCHLELSHYHKKFERETGLPNFLQAVNKWNIDKTQSLLDIENAAAQADKAMQQNGIVAVGDICNTTNSISIKKNSPLHYHSFVECISIRESDTQRRFDEYVAVLKKFEHNNLTASLALHAPYTCNESLYKKVNQHSDFISIHNQESSAENLLFAKQSSDFDNFYEHFGLDQKEIIKPHTATSSFKNSQRLLEKDIKKLFVHNTYTRQQDVAFADENSWFCFCPKANLYIENCLPQMQLFVAHINRIVLGTDSLASNDSLNILAEVKTIHDHFPAIPLNKILQWATINGARLFGLENTLGSLEVGKTPGLVWVKDFKPARQTGERETLMAIKCEQIFIY